MARHLQERGRHEKGGCSWGFIRKNIGANAARRKPLQKELKAGRSAPAAHASANRVPLRRRWGRPCGMGRGRGSYIIRPCRFFHRLFLTTYCRANTLPCPGFPQLMAGLLSKKAARMLCRFIIEMSRDNIGNLLIWMFFMRRFRLWTVTAISVLAPPRRSARRWRNRQNIFFWK